MLSVSHHPIRCEFRAQGAEAEALRFWSKLVLFPLSICTLLGNSSLHPSGEQSWIKRGILFRLGCVLEWFIKLLRATDNFQTAASVHADVFLHLVQKQGWVQASSVPSKSAHSPWQQHLFPSGEQCQSKGASQATGVSWMLSGIVTGKCPAPPAVFSMLPPFCSWEELSMYMHSSQMESWFLVALW